MGVSGISSGFPLLSQSPGQVPHVLLTRSPLHLPQSCDWLGAVRLACVKHAASVRPEPGSNSPSRSVLSWSPKGRFRVRSFEEPALEIPDLEGQLARGRTLTVVRSSASCIDSARFDCSKCARTRFWLPLFRFQGAPAAVARVSEESLVRAAAWRGASRLRWSSGHLEVIRPVRAVRRFLGGFSTYSRAEVTVKMTGNLVVRGFASPGAANGSGRGASLYGTPPETATDFTLSGAGAGCGCGRAARPVA